MRDRAVRVADLNQLRLWVGSEPEVPEGDWYRDFGSFRICGHGTLPKTFLLRGQVAKGQKLQITAAAAETANQHIAVRRDLSKTKSHAF
jgi:hypothetical protein